MRRDVFFLTCESIEIIGCLVQRLKEAPQRAMHEVNKPAWGQSVSYILQLLRICYRSRRVFLVFFGTLLDIILKVFYTQRRVVDVRKVGALQV